MQPIQITHHIEAPGGGPLIKIRWRTVAARCGPILQGPFSMTSKFKEFSLPQMHFQNRTEAH